jgi:hypothetical protein
MDVLFYKTLHVLGVMLLFTALGGAAALAFGAGSPRLRKLAGITHGVALLILLVSGFGALAKLGFGMPPGWAWGKLVIWLLLGGLIVLMRKKPQQAGLWWWLAPILGLVAGSLALYKPF